MDSINKSRALIPSSRQLQRRWPGLQLLSVTSGWPSRPRSGNHLIGLMR
jgi:hypothetical protein